ncbi:hypothetical protein CPB84DRAFT_1848661 [Gymnopilus junonius]|uniref:Uncharacterized protein n=1 Tax=Gymnopilus junonius TaxID=109634 RepID=A0A9P5NJL6_GYMJU|nr:hypothetical protein CPB84DRAFT_1848661 [Gymnopilus junonius]
MAIRLASLFNNNTKVIILLCITFIVEAASVVISEILGRKSDSLPVQHLTDMASDIFCVQDNILAWTYLVWVPVGCFEALVLLMAIYVAVRHHRYNKADPPALLHHSLLRDNLAFPAIHLLVCAGNFVAWRFPPYVVGQMGLALVLFVSCITGPRSIINLRKAFYQAENDTIYIEDNSQQDDDGRMEMESLEFL